MRRITCVLGSTGATILALALPTGATAAQTIGATATGNPTNCGQNLAYVSIGTFAGAYSPSAYGVITSWSHRGNSAETRTAQLLVLRPNPGAGATHFIATQRDQVRTSLAGQLNTYTSGVRLPIEPNERLGLFIPAGQPTGDGSCAFGAPAGNSINWPFVSGEPPPNVSVDYPNTFGSLRLNASAVVEPDADRDVFGDETQDNCIGTAGTVGGCPNTVTAASATGKGNKVLVTMTAPGAGSLKAGSTTDPTLLAAIAKKKKKKAQPPLTQTSQTLTAKTKQTVTLTLNLSKAGKGKLARKGKLGVTIKVLYTPTGGTAGAVTTTAKLRRKKKG